MTNTTSQVAAALLNQSPDKAIVITMTGETQIALMSAGSMPSSEALVMISSALAKVFSELPPEILSQMTLTQWLNNSNSVVTNQVQKLCPHLFELAMPEPVQENPLAPVSELLATAGQTDEAGKNATEANVDALPCNDVADEEPKPKVTRKRVPRTKATEPTPEAQEVKPTANATGKRAPTKRVQRTGTLAGRGKTK